jgi:hypothetical protein
VIDAVIDTRMQTTSVTLPTREATASGRAYGQSTSITRATEEAA